MPSQRLPILSSATQVFGAGFMTVDIPAANTFTGVAAEFASLNAAASAYPAPDTLNLNNSVNVQGPMSTYSVGGQMIAPTGPYRPVPSIGIANTYPPAIGEWGWPGSNVYIGGTTSMTPTGNPCSAVALAPFHASNSPVYDNSTTLWSSAFLGAQRYRDDFEHRIRGYANPNLSPYYIADAQLEPTLPTFYLQQDGATNATATNDLIGPWAFDFNNGPAPAAGVSDVNFTRLTPMHPYFTNMKNHNGPFPLAMFGEASGQVQYRLVSACLRVKYTGTEEQRGGLLTITEHPEHQATIGKTVAQLQAYDVTRTEAVASNKWHSCHYSGPINENEIQFSTTVNPTPFMTIVASGGNNLSFDVEAYANYEFAGDPIRDKITVTSDEQGGNAVVAAAHDLVTNKRFTWGSGKKLVKAAKRMVGSTSGVSYLLSLV